MARLNEAPAPPAESVDSLKRRFIRQNREITRANSAQSIRIRGLECETSRLLTENLSLREQVIRLSKHLEVYSARRSSAEKLDQIKAQLEAKLAEVGALVHDLGGIHRSKRTSTASRKSVVPHLSPKRSPITKDWRRAIELEEIAAIQEGRLPLIREDKSYPRKTLERDNFLSLTADLANVTDSPELGPPPIAHLDVPVSDKDDGNRSSVLEQESDLGFASIPGLGNLETRRRRRESTFSKDKTDDENVVHAPESQPAIGTPAPVNHLKAGAKRKFSARELDETSPPQVAVLKDNFQFRRNDITSVSVDPVKVSEPQDTKFIPLEYATILSGDKPSQDLEVITKPVPLRQALGEKSANKSPAKSKRSISSNTSDPKKDSSDEKPSRDDPRNLPITHPKNPSRKVTTRKPQDLSMQELELHPIQINVPLELETPLHPITTILSPETIMSDQTDSTDVRPSSRDTPPPSDLDVASAAAAGRGSRRARPSVSYVEPNLRDKMRRPSKQLVDAVGADEKVRRGLAQSAAEERVRKAGEDDDCEIVSEKGTLLAKVRTVVIKKDPDLEVEAREGEESWKNLPLAEKRANDLGEDVKAPESPLGEKAERRDLPASVLTGRRGHVSMALDEHQLEPDEIKTKDSGSSKAIAALTVTRPTKTSSSRTTTTSTAANRETRLAQEPKDPLKVPSNLHEVIDTEPCLPLSNSKEPTPSTNTNLKTRPPSTSATHHRSTSTSTSSKTSRRYSTVPENLRNQSSAETTSSKRDGTTTTVPSASSRPLSAASTSRRRESVATRNAMVAGGGSGVGAGTASGDEKDRGTGVGSRRRSMMI
ncbi:hypothetical protein MMC25_002067 [Agyrium rufum]|nr:hypothetical protein [Agyrium rufum]